MACIADWLVAAPFAMLGSIGVVGGIPNFNKALKKAGVEYFHFTAGIYFRPIPVQRKKSTL